MGARPELLASLRSKPTSALDLSGWVRIVEYRYCLEPLSPAGSLRGIGARFNVGSDLAVSGFKAWPALYLAEDFETAYREKYQCPRGTAVGGLTPEELSLQVPDSYLVAVIDGRVSSLLDVSDTEALRPFCTAIAQFKMPGRVTDLARKLGIRPPQLIRNPQLLQRAVLSPAWRAPPAQFDLPSPSQIFGGLVRDAGYEAVLYQSSKSNKRCLSMFPDNLSGSDTQLCVRGDYPASVKIARLDAATWPEIRSTIL